MDSSNQTFKLHNPKDLSLSPTACAIFAPVTTDVAVANNLYHKEQLRHIVAKLVSGQQVKYLHEATHEAVENAFLDFLIYGTVVINRKVKRASYKYIGTILATKVEKRVLNEAFGRSNDH